MSKKSPLTAAGIEPATFRFVAQHLNHCATAVPRRCLGAVAFKLKLSEARRNYPTLYDPSVAHYNNIHCGHLLRILESQLGESGFKIPSLNCLP